MTTGGRKIQEARFSNKSSRFFEMHWTSDTPETTVALEPRIWSLQNTTSHALFTRSLKMHGCQVGAAKPREHDLTKKKSYFFSKYIGPVTSIWTFSVPQTVHMVFTERLLARTMFARSIKVLGWQLGQKIPRSSFLQ